MRYSAQIKRKGRWESIPQFEGDSAETVARHIHKLGYSLTIKVRPINTFDWVTFKFNADGSPRHD